MKFTFNIFSLAYLLTIIQFVAIELYAVRHPATHDTFSEHWWKFQEVFPPAAIFLTLLLVWLWLHLVLKIL